MRGVFVYKSTVALAPTLNQVIVRCDGTVQVSGFGAEASATI